MLKNHPEVHNEPIQVYFTEIGDYSHNIDVFSYVATGDYGKYKKIAHELNNSIMEIVEKAGVRLARPAAAALVAVSAGLVILSAGVQARVSAEKDEILPLLREMSPNARVLALPFRTGSDAVDPAFFYQIHHHDPNWYHVVVGGGANPGLFPNAWLPVQYRADFSLPKPEVYGERYEFLPKPEVLTHFTWEDYEPHYDYVLARGAPRSFVEYLSDHLGVTRSGSWTLFAPDSAVTSRPSSPPSP